MPHHWQYSRYLFFKPVSYLSNLRPVRNKENWDSGISIHAVALVIFLGPGARGEWGAVVWRICFKCLFVSLLVPLINFCSVQYRSWAGHFSIFISFITMITKLKKFWNGCYVLSPSSGNPFLMTEPITLHSIWVIMFGFFLCSSALAMFKQRYLAFQYWSFITDF